MVVGILDKGIRKKLLQESNLTLQSCIDICRSNECTKQQLQTMDQPEEVHVVDKNKPKVDQRNSGKYHFAVVCSKQRLPPIEKKNLKMSERRNLKMNLRINIQNRK